MPNLTEFPIMNAAVARLTPLRGAFRSRGLDLRFVGGCVRDLLTGVDPHDIDICTDATPEEQEQIYIDLGVRHVSTGLKHGTWTVIVDDDLFEVTSLRTETDHDGRHASVRYIRDWTEDLARRDLTINAMAMDFDGNLLDPFGGASDLAAGRVRFVGDAGQRMREDYLRILRWLRFHGRFAGRTMVLNKLDRAACVELLGANAEGYRKGLAGISAERVWSEIRRMTEGPNGLKMLSALYELGLGEACRIPELRVFPKARLRVAARAGSSPVTMMAVWMGSGERTKQLAASLKWSRQETRLGVLVARFASDRQFGLSRAKDLVAVDGFPVDDVAEVLRSRGRSNEAEELLAWDAPNFPVSGDDLKALGFEAGPDLGRVLHRLLVEWSAQNYQPTKQDLLALVE